jgi:hypothetical protein
MKYAVAVLLGFAIFAAQLCEAQEAYDTTQGEAAAGAWLALTDVGNASASWDQANERFKSRIDKAEWQKGLNTVRAPLGVLRARTRSSAQFTRSLMGAPEGEYVVIQYDTKFDNKASAVETVTVARGKDGVWRVAGYYIK